jgi:Tfp pilus assembly protein PilN
VARVNLLPPEILEGRRFRRVQVLLGLAVLACIALAGAATWWAHTTVTDAQADLDAAQARVTTLQRKQAQYAEVPKITAEVDAATAARAQAMSTDVTWYRYLGELNAALPGGVVLKSLTVTMAAAGVPAAAADPLSVAGIGTIAVDGTAPSYPAVSSWLDALDDVGGVDYPALSNAARSSIDANTELITFNSSAVVTEKALSHLYEGKDG